MKNIRIGGVPEHFNHPWHEAIENGRFAEKGINISWVDYSNGTGAMCADLRENKIDLAIVLTEGAVADIAKNQDFSILQFYVKSPLTWGIHTGANSSIQEVSPIQSKKIAISRFGSGSHLMSYVLAENLQESISKENFTIVENLKGAITSLCSLETDLFLWEKFTTKPCVDRGEFRRIGELDTPWPCFVIIVKKEFLKQETESVNSVLEVINEATKDASENTNTVKAISSRYHLQESDVTEWYSKLVWASDSVVEKKVLENVVDTLYKLNLIPEKISVSSLVSPITTVVE